MDKLIQVAIKYLLDEEFNEADTCIIELRDAFTEEDIMDAIYNSSS